MAINGNFPNTSPSLLLDFANTEVLDPRITFTRSTTAVYYNGVTTTKAEENYILQSQDFGTTWTATNANVAVNVAVAPDDTSTADRLEFNGGSAACRVNQTLPANTNSNQIFSVFIKNDGVNYVQLSTDNANVFADFDLLNVTVGTTGASATANITASANSYVRCAIAFATNAVSSVRIQGVDSNTAAHNSVLTNAANVIAWGAQVEQRSVSYPTSYTATTTQPITNYIPTLLTAPAGIARFDHNPTTGESLGLLVEEQRTNLFTYSDDFANASWGKAASSITANTIVAPDGTLTGDKLVEDTTNASHGTHKDVGGIVLNAPMTFSVFVKAAERTSGALVVTALTSPFPSYALSFDLTNGTISTSGSTVSASSITNVGNGWYRVSISGFTGLDGLHRYSIRPNQSAAYTGNGYSGIYIWGAQLEAAAFPTSYIPTVAATVTRNADAASMTGTNFSSWFNNAEGTLFADWVAGPIGPSGFPRTVELSEGTISANFIRIQRYSTGTVRFSVTAQAAFDSSIVSLGGVAKAALTYKVNDIAGTANAASPTADTSANIPVIDKMTIGETASSGSPLNSTIKKISYYPTRLSDAQLQALTTS